MSKNKSKNVGGRPKGSTTSEKRILTRIRNNLPNATINEVIEALLKLAINKDGTVPAQTQRGACKDLLQLGIDVEKELAKLNSLNEDETEEDTEKASVTSIFSTSSK